MRKRDGCGLAGVSGRGEVLGEEDGGVAQDGGLGRGGEPVAFAGEEVGLVGDAGEGEGAVELMGFGNGDDGVGFSVEEEGGREEWGEGGGGVGAGEAAGDFDDDPYIARGGCGGLGGEGDGKEGSERDAEKGDAGGVYGGLGGDVREGVGAGFEPEGDVVAVEDGLGVGAGGTGALKILGREDGDASKGDEGGDAVEPEADVASGAVEEEDGGELGGGGGWGDSVKADGFAAGEEGLHGGVGCLGMLGA